MVIVGLIIHCTTVFADENSQSIQQNIDNLVRTNACAGCDLRGADLNRMILSGADLSDADLSGASFFLADLSDANLSGANLRDAKFGGADLANADLSGADLRGALLDGAFLKGSIMDGEVVEATQAEDDPAAEVDGKVYVPDQTQPKEVMDQKKAAMADKTLVEKTTGYILGGVSPLNQKKRLKTVLDSSAEQFPTVYVSAGRRGLEIELSPEDLVNHTHGSVQPIC